MSRTYTGQHSFPTRAVRYIQPSLTEEMDDSVACSSVHSRRDNANALYVGMSSANFDAQQRVQNAIARVVTPTWKRDRVTLILKRLYWLPVHQRVTYKTATFVYSIRRNRKLDYLFFLLEDYIPRRQRRSSSIRCLNAPRTKLKTGNGFRHRRTAYVECIATESY